MSDFNIDSILDGTLDDLADLPEFKPFPVGTHKAVLTMEQKVVNKHPAIEVKLKALETIELPSGSEAEPVSPGQEGTVLYMLDNELGQGKFKKLLKQLAETYGTDKTNRQIMETINWRHAQQGQCNKDLPRKRQSHAIRIYHMDYRKRIQPSYRMYHG